MAISFPASPTDGQIYSPGAPAPNYTWSATRGVWINGSVFIANGAGAFTTLSASGAVSGAGIIALLSPYAAAIASIAALRANTATPVSYYVAGYHAAQDGGEGTFAYVASDTSSADNGGTIIVDANGHRWYRMYNKQPLNLCWFGGFINSATDSSAALVAALAAGNAIFLPGPFTFTSAISYTFPNNTASLSIFGAGAKVSLLTWPTAASGFTLNFQGPLNSVHLHDFTMETGVTGTSGAAVTLNQAAPLGAENAWEQSDFTNVTIRGADGPDLTNYWGTGIAINGVSGVNFFNLKIDGQNVSSTGYASVGVGVSTIGTSTIIPVLYNFTNCNFTYCGTGFVYGDWVQGVSFSQCNWTGGNIGIEVPASAAGTTLAQLALLGCQLNCLSYGIWTASAVAGVTVNGTTFYELEPNSVGIYLQITEGFSIVGNVFEGPGPAANTSTGINIGSNPVNFGGIIMGNNFFRHDAAITLEVSSHLVNVQSNTYAQNTTDINNFGTSNTIGGGSS